MIMYPKWIAQCLIVSSSIIVVIKSSSTIVIITIAFSCCHHKLPQTQWLNPDKCINLWSEVRLS